MFLKNNVKILVCDISLLGSLLLFKLIPGIIWDVLSCQISLISLILINVLKFSENRPQNLLNIFGLGESFQVNSGANEFSDCDRPWLKIICLMNDVLDFVLIWLFIT